MATVNERLADAHIRRALALRKVGNGIERELERIILATQGDVAGILGKHLAMRAAKGAEPGWKANRLERGLKELQDLYRGVFDETDATLYSALSDVARSEGEFHAEALRTAIPVDVKIVTPPPSVFTALAQGAAVDGITKSLIIEGLTTDVVVAIARTINTGAIAGQSMDEMIRQAVQRGVDLPRQKIAQMTRTSMMSVVNDAAQETYKANAHVLRGWQYVATLDLRTCPVCASLDGQVFPLGEGPVPPRHPNSRSISVPVTKSYDELGIEKEEYSNRVRASMDGQIASPKNMESWLKAQSVARQEAILGKTKARLWREGKFRLSDFVRDDRTILSLDDLRKLKPSAFTD